MTDEQLRQAERVARLRAHNASGPPSESFFLAAREYGQLRNERERRGLQPLPLKDDKP